MDGDDVEARLEAVERALADGDADLTGIGEAAERERKLEELRARVDDLESQVTDLSASVQAVRGYVGNVRTVNRDVERRADAALARVEELDRHGTDRGRRDSIPDADVSRQPGRHRPRSDGRDGDPPESPGDIARRITGREEGQHERRPPRDGRDRGGVRRQREGAGRRARSRDESGAPTGSDGRDDEDGFLSGLRDAF
ncbi:DUF7310 family coiled-coil domain-containing protein [Halorientalis pallida]|uniref:DUF7310 domain-containing protein n=1 Tax=Halorientalis pallida TaxID=2479928 RepID=A0A498KV88_9EURY|nr:hypothetical protein [Halorientalis pallida]RXK48479.1 hypothetical protein EAF64_12420 [Halorientalis pallida]